MDTRAGLLAIPLVLAAWWATPAAAQREPDEAAVRVTAYGGVSLREGLGGLRWAKDVASTSVRLTRPHRVGVQPWIQLERFVRPDFECLPSLACNDTGWTALVGMVAPFGGADTRPGVLHPYLLAGVGWAFSDENRFAYAMGLGAAFPVVRRFAPAVEIRWEDLPGIRNVVMVNLGLRVDLF